MSKRGGYTIVDFADVALIDGAAAGVKVAGATAAIADAGKKATLVSGLVVDGAKYDDLYVNFNLTEDGYLGVVWLSKDEGLEILVEDGDYVTVTSFEAGGGGETESAITLVDATGLALTETYSGTVVKAGLYADLVAAYTAGKPIYLTGAKLSAALAASCGPVPAFFTERNTSLNVISVAYYTPVAEGTPVKIITVDSNDSVNTR